MQYFLYYVKQISSSFPYEFQYMKISLTQNQLLYSADRSKCRRTDKNSKSSLSQITIQKNDIFGLRVYAKYISISFNR